MNKNINDIQGAIFDMDGVLLDSMPMWDHAGELYLASIGVEAEPNLEDELFTMTMIKGAEYMKEHYKLPYSPEEIMSGINNTIADFYAHKAVDKPGIRNLLAILKNKDIPVTVATSTDRQHVEAALIRLDLIKYIDRIFTCSEIGVGKVKPDIFLKAAEYMRSPVDKTYVFEDAYHAAETAQNAGFKVVGIYDDSSKKMQDRLIENSDYYVQNADEIIKLLAKNTALTIAGSDTSGGAGIQADLKTMQANGVYGMSAITALTAQNTTGVTGIMDVTPEFLELEIRAVFDDIRPDAVKIGMVSSKSLIETIAGLLREYKATNIVVDPVMVATSGAKLISDEAIDTLTSELFPLATVITPNIPEAEVLSGLKIGDDRDMLKAAELIHDRYSCAVLLKGGHSIETANDLLYQDKEKYFWITGERIDNPNTHGTGCTLSSAIAANLAKGQELFESVRNAKTYISRALTAMMDLGKGSGPLDHGFNVK